MNLDHLAAFVEVADSGSFSKAAQRLGCPLPTLSRQVAQLEKDLGTRLFERTTRSLHLTPLGSEVLKRARGILAGVAETESLARTAQAPPRGLLRLAVGVEFGLQALSPLLGTFTTWYPDVDLEIELTGRSLDLVAEGYDIAVRAGEPPPSGMEHRRLGEFRSSLVASSSFLSSRRGIMDDDLDLETFSGLPGLSFQNRGHWTLEHAATGRRKTLRLQPRLSSNNGSLLLSAAEQGVGIACLPRFLTRASVTRGRLRDVAPSWATPPIPIHAAYPPKAALSRNTGVFLDFLEQNLRLEAPTSGRDGPSRRK